MYCEMGVLDAIKLMSGCNRWVVRPFLYSKNVPRQDWNSCESEVLPFSGPNNYITAILRFGHIAHAIHAILGIRGCSLLTCL